ncbi:hypothetical protein FACS18949_02250 [Clostridia bacterium]|nr:hypothetical protein FACS189425_11240 [Clostridia bacterium]GHV32153.1 hypothetical protein FACS18949_02250 [Clostridia bacterium]
MTIRELGKVVTPNRDVAITTLGHSKYFSGRMNDVQEDLLDREVREITTNVFYDEKRKISHYYSVLTVFIDNIEEWDLIADISPFRLKKCDFDELLNVINTDRQSGLTELREILKRSTNPQSACSTAR